MQVISKIDAEMILPSVVARFGMFTHNNKRKASRQLKWCRMPCDKASELVAYLDGFDIQCTVTDRFDVSVHVPLDFEYGSLVPTQRKKAVSNCHVQLLSC